MSKLLIYTAIIGAYERACSPAPEETSRDVDFVCFTDTDMALPEGVERIPWKRKHRDVTRDAREIKICKFADFNEYDWVVWADANSRVDPGAIRAHLDGLEQDSKLCVFHHDVRDCLYEEAQWAFSHPADSPALVSAQVNRYSREGFPAHFGLANTNLLARRPRDPEACAFSRQWWQEVDQGSRRDQLSFDYVRWKSEWTPDYFPGLWYSSLFSERCAEHSYTRKCAVYGFATAFEWARRIFLADDLFREVLYDYRGPKVSVHDGGTSSKPPHPSGSPSTTK